MARAVVALEQMFDQGRRVTRSDGHVTRSHGHGTSANRQSEPERPERRGDPKLVDADEYIRPDTTDEALAKLAV